MDKFSIEELKNYAYIKNINIQGLTEKDQIIRAISKSYKKPQQSTYQEPQQSTYQQPQQPIFRQPTYQQPQQSIFRQPQQSTYQQPKQSTYQQPQQSTYQQPQQSTYQQPKQLPQQTYHQPQTIVKSTNNLYKLIRGKPEDAPEDLSFSWYIPLECLKNFGNLQIGKFMGSGKFGSVYEICENTNNCQKIVKVVPLRPTVYGEHIMNYIKGYINAETYQKSILREKAYLEYFYRRDKQIPVSNYDDELINMFEPYYFVDDKSIKYETKFKNEAEINKIASDLGVSPKFYNAFICSNVLPIPETFLLIDLGFIVTDKWDIILSDYFEKYNKSLPEHIINLMKEKLRKLHSARIAHRDLHEGNIILKLDKQNNPIDIAFIDFGQSINLIEHPEEEENSISDDKFNLKEIINRMKLIYSLP